MDECRRVFLDNLTSDYYNFSDSDWKNKKILDIIEQYARIERSVRRGENFTIKDE